MLLLIFPMTFICLVFCIYWLLRLWQWSRLPQRLDSLSQTLWRWVPGSISSRLKRLFDSEDNNPNVHRLLSSWMALLMVVSGLSFLYGEPLLVMATALLMLFQISKNQSRFKSKQQAIVKELPDFCDMLAMMIAAGIPLIPAMGRVAVACDGGRLAKEMTRMNHQLRQGVPFSEALQRTATRYRLPLLNEWTGLLIQGHQQGSSLVTTLRFHSLQMRQQLLNEAEKRAQEAPVKLLFPLMTCFFPVNFLVILGPIVLQISEGGL